MMSVHHDERANAEFWPDCASLAEEVAVLLRNETRDPEDGGVGGSGGDRTRIPLPYDDTDPAHRALESTREWLLGSMPACEPSCSDRDPAVAPA
jgi:hypothetical protein